MSAKRPSKKHRGHREMEFEIRLIPVISLLCVLIPILLQGAAFVHTASQEVNLPSTDEVSYVGATPPAAAETVTLAVSESGFTLASGSQILARIPRTASGYDFAALASAAAAAKRRYPGQDSVILLIGDRVLYEDIIHAMDQCRPHFPAISMADRVETAPGG